MSCQLPIIETFAGLAIAFVGFWIGHLCGACATDDATADRINALNAKIAELKENQK